MKQEKILIYGYGNPGRQDDGLGNAFIERIDQWIKDQKLSNVFTDSNYQLNIEDASNISDKDVVIFVDASLEERDGFHITRVIPSPKVDFTMHAVTPNFVLNLCQEIYNKIPDAYLLHLKGYEWEMKEELTKGARENLENALEYIKKIIVSPTLLKEVIED